MLCVKYSSWLFKFVWLLAFTGLACKKPAKPIDLTAPDSHAAHAHMGEAHSKIRGDTLHLPTSQEELSALQLDTAKLKSLAEKDNLLGVAALDEEKVTVVSARVKGRLQRLYVRNPGELVRKGQPIFQIYSEELQTQVQEFRLLLQEAARTSNDPKVSKLLLAGARKKLFRWGLTEPQLREISLADKPSAYLTYYSPATGYLSDLAVREGQYVDIGTTLFKLADLSSLWVETQIYANEIRDQDRQTQVSLYFEVYPAEKFTGRLVYLNPKLEENQKISLVRYSVANPGIKIKPGMMAYVHQDQNSRPVIVVPKTTLILGNMKSVWVKTGKGMFERRMVQTGIENKNEMEVLSGIDPGEVVVSSGGYLLSSELILRQGGGTMHNHSE